ncbi:MAG: hypothetical protein RMA76_00700 [Deltaproteobacteria bacterium]|jgi:hypothetical protein
MKQLTTTLTLLALCSACGGLEDDLTASTSDEASFKTTSPQRDQLIRDFGMDGDLCFAGQREVMCVSADRRTPLSVGDAVGGSLSLCAETQRGRVSCGEPDVQAYWCGLGGCICQNYADCWKLAVEKDCTVHPIPCAGCPVVTGVCTPGQ